MNKTLDATLGFGGVHGRENPRALKWGPRLEIPMLLLALWVLVEWYLALKGELAPNYQRMSDWGIWGFFLLELTLVTLLCTDKIRHLKRNWASLLIIALAFPPFHEHGEFSALRFLRFFFLVGFFSQNFQLTRAVLLQNKLGKTLLVGALLITGGGILIASIDPSIQSPGEGVWWAWVTVTTVGYGDLVPTSAEGKIFASFLILLGICLVSLLTANVSAFLLSRQNQKEISLEQVQIRKLVALEKRIDNIEAKLDKLLERLDKPSK